MRLITGIQPSGVITIGNYIGAIKNLESQLDKTDDVYIFIADQHALTVTPDSDVLRNHVKSLVSLYIAMGIHEKASIFVQSSLASHSELAWILQCHTKMGELSRMTQYKDKSKNNDNSGVGLFTYPTLMAADILLYQADAVPVGEDQKQHLELTRDIAERFNKFYDSEVFKVPEPMISKGVSKIYSLTDPSKKMSKSDENEKSYISILDPEDKILKKIKSATTDSLGEINYDPENQPGVSNLLTIYSCFSNKSMEDTLKHFEGQNYGFLKNEVAQAVISVLIPIQERYEETLKNDDLIHKVLEEGRNNAFKVSDETIKKVKETVGFYKL